MNLKKYTEANRIAWNEATLIHQKSDKENLPEKVKELGFNVLDPIETAKLQELIVQGKKVAHLCCHNGIELLSILNLGAKSGVGFDISDEAIKEANLLETLSGLNCSFIRTDVYEIEETYMNAFDLVYISAGSLTWLPDLDRFFQIVSNLLKPESHLLLYEIHPFVNMLEVDEEWNVTKKQEADPPVITHSYFRTDPWIGTTGLDFIGKTRYPSKPNFEFTHQLSDILNAVIRSGIAIKEFTEYAHDKSGIFTYLEKEGKVPYVIC